MHCWTKSLRRFKIIQIICRQFKQSNAPRWLDNFYKKKAERKTTVLLHSDHMTAGKVYEPSKIKVWPNKSRHLPV